MAYNNNQRFDVVQEVGCASTGRAVKVAGSTLHIWWALTTGLSHAEVACAITSCNEIMYFLGFSIANGRYCHVMYKLLYPSIIGSGQRLLCADLCDSWPESFCRPVVGRCCRNHLGTLSLTLLCGIHFVTWKLNHNNTYSGSVLSC